MLTKTLDIVGHVLHISYHMQVVHLVIIAYVLFGANNNSNSNNDTNIYICTYIHTYIHTHMNIMYQLGIRGQMPAWLVLATVTSGTASAFGTGTSLAFRRPGYMKASDAVLSSSQVLHICNSDSFLLSLLHQRCDTTSAGQSPKANCCFRLALSWCKPRHP